MCIFENIWFLVFVTRLIHLWLWLTLLDWWLVTSGEIFLSRTLSISISLKLSWKNQGAFGPNWTNLFYGSYLVVWASLKIPSITRSISRRKEPNLSITYLPFCYHYLWRKWEIWKELKILVLSEKHLVPGHILSTSLVLVHGIKFQNLSSGLDLISWRKPVWPASRTGLTGFGRGSTPLTPTREESFLSLPHSLPSDQARGSSLPHDLPSPNHFPPWIFEVHSREEVQSFEIEALEWIKSAWPDWRPFLEVYLILSIPLKVSNASIARSLCSMHISRIPLSK